MIPLACSCMSNPGVLVTQWETRIGNFAGKAQLSGEWDPRSD